MQIVDMHCDTIAELYYRKRDGKPYDLKTCDLQVTLDKMKQGDWLLQNFACFINLSKVEHPFAYTNILIDAFDEQMARHKDLIRPVKNREEIERNIRDGVMSALLTIEEGEACEGSPENMKHFYDRGARMMTLTWNYENSLAFPNRAVFDCSDGQRRGKQTGTVPETEHGLKKKGFEMVEAMEDTGMIIDVSHLGDAGIRDVLKATRKPFVASHSNARALAGHPRNLTDEMIRAMAERGCVAGINYCGSFLRDFEKGEPEISRIEDVIRHILYFREKGGIEFIGLGSDFDGFENPMEWKDAAGVPRLLDAMKKAGLTSAEIDKITHENVLRLYKEVLG